MIIEGNTHTVKDSQIIEGYRKKLGFTQAAMARALDISRQGLFQYINDINAPDVSILMKWFRQGDPDWVREMALEIFVRRPEMYRPCVCLEHIGDNGPCPRHTATLVEEPEA